MSTPAHWNYKSAEKTIDELSKLLELRSQNDIELHVEQVRQRRTILTFDYFLSSLGTFENGTLEEHKMQNIMILKIWFIECR